jgi:hypothetical protein
MYYPSLFVNIDRRPFYEAGFEENLSSGYEKGQMAVGLLFFLTGRVLKSAFKPFMLRQG